MSVLDTWQHRRNQALDGSPIGADINLYHVGVGPYSESQVLHSGIKHVFGNLPLFISDLARMYT